MHQNAEQDTQSPASPTADSNDCTSTGSEKERGAETRRTGQRGTRRRMKNRDAARKSRKKQTERADELHEELQQEERKKSALQKEITELHKACNHYMAILEDHKSHCVLKPSSYQSADDLVESTPPRAVTEHSEPPQASSRSSAAGPSTATGQTDGTVSIPLPVSTSARPPATTSSGSAVSFPDAPHSLFNENPPTLITSVSVDASVTLDCADLFSNPVSPSVASAAAQPPSPLVSPSLEPPSTLLSQGVQAPSPSQPESLISYGFMEANNYTSKLLDDRTSATETFLPLSPQGFFDCNLNSLNPPHGPFDPILQSLSIFAEADQSYPSTDTTQIFSLQSSEVWDDVTLPAELFELKEVSDWIQQQEIDFK